jgi:Glycosyl transferase family 2
MVLTLVGIVLLFLGQFSQGLLTPMFLGGLVAMVCGMLLLHRCQGRAASLPVILLVALIIRLLFVPWPHNSDLNRYLWEGRMQQVGLNPYLTAPAAEETLPYRDGVWQDINHPDYPAVYGPAAQLVFRLALLTPSPAVALKLIFLSCDLTILLLLVTTLRRYRMEVRLAWLYAAHPLPPLLLIGEGHLEPLLVLPLFAALLALQLRHHRLGLILFSLAITVKVSLVVLVPFVLRIVRPRLWPWAALPLLLWLPFGEGFPSHLSTLARFSQSEPFNSFALTLLSPLLPMETARMASVAVFILGLLILWLLDPPPLVLPLSVLSLLLLTSPIVHPWYLAMLLPFAVFQRSLPWLVLATTALPLLLVIKVYAATGHWHTPTWLLTLEFLPFVAAVALCLRRRSDVAPAWFTPPTSLSVLIPVLNEEANLSGCLQSIVLPRGIAAEIVVVDGGSSDGTRQLAEADPRVRLISSAGGRGTQLSAGYMAARGDLLVIVHGDSRFGPTTLDEILEHCRSHPHVAGGACRGRYRQVTGRLRLVEHLNDLRVLWAGIAFGDQAQFLRRQALGPEEFPDFKLMEDVELSLRLRRRGALSLLATTVSASSRRWQKVGYLGNTLQVLFLCGLFLLLRSLGATSDKGDRFYRWYYGKAVPV